jgi:hypothetical protein
MNRGWLRQWPTDARGGQRLTARHWSCTPRSCHNRCTISAKVRSGPLATSSNNQGACAWHPGRLSSVATPRPRRAVPVRRHAETEAKLKDGGFRSRIHRRASRNHPLSDAQTRANRAKSRIRARIEHVFGAQQSSVGGKAGVSAPLTLSGTRTSPMRRLWQLHVKWHKHSHHGVQPLSRRCSSTTSLTPKRSPRMSFRRPARPYPARRRLV